MQKVGHPNKNVKVGNPCGKHCLVASAGGRHNKKKLAGFRRQSGRGPSRARTCRVCSAPVDACCCLERAACAPAGSPRRAPPPPLCDTHGVRFCASRATAGGRSRVVAAGLSKIQICRASYVFYF